MDFIILAVLLMGHFIFCVLYDKTEKKVHNDKPDKISFNARMLNDLISYIVIFSVVILVYNFLLLIFYILSKGLLDAILAFALLVSLVVYLKTAYEKIGSSGTERITLSIINIIVFFFIVLIFLTKLLQII